MRSHSYINTAHSIIDAYDGSIPLAAWLKQFFRDNKKIGSRDRKIISHACYSFYRLGNAWKDQTFEERILIALFLVSTEQNIILQEQRSEWNETVSRSLHEKLGLLHPESSSIRFFPLLDQVSPEIDKQNFNVSLLIQPDLFLRVRPGKQDIVSKKLLQAGIQFSAENDAAIRLTNGTKVEDILSIDEEVVIQDLNSQNVLEPVYSVVGKEKKFSTWDCCAASGGKSILLYDHFPRVQITVSDIRESIIINLRNRFRKAGITNFHQFVADVSSPGFNQQKKYDLIICDAPCSGSGTWGRTPEQLKFFKKEKINDYAALQKRIAANAAKSLNKGGCLLYITCSVFFAENEEVVRYIQLETDLQPISTHYFKGYDQKADTLFAALFTL